MRHQSPLSRAVALAGLVLVPWGIMGFGVHDPDCPHHRLGTVGSPHPRHGALGRASRRIGASDLASAAPAVSQAGQEERGGGSRDQDCHCFGVCVLGAHPADLPVRAVSVAVATLPRIHLVRELPSNVAPITPVAGRLPPATGPPSRA